VTVPPGTAADVRLPDGRVETAEPGSMAVQFPSQWRPLVRERNDTWQTGPSSYDEILTAAPTRSLYQTDSIGLRCILRTTWAVRAPGMVQVINAVTW
jgi:hypothetical protein